MSTSETASTETEPQAEPQAETDTPPAPSNPVRTLLRERSFVCVWGIGGLTGIVRWLQLLVLGIYTYQITGSPLLVSVVPILWMLPLSLCGPLVGAVADRFSRKTLLVIALTSVLTLSVIAAVFASSGGLSFAHIALISVFSGLFWATDMPVRRRLLGDLAGRSVSSAMGLDSATSNATRMAGPLLGGVTLELFSISGVFVLSAVIYTLCLLLILIARVPTHTRATTGTMFLREFIGGIRYVLGNHSLRRIFAVTIVFNVFGFSFTSMIPIIGTDHLGLAPFMVGLMSSMEGMGAFCGAILIAFYAVRTYFFSIYLWGTTFYVAMIGYLGVLTFVAGGPTHSTVAVSGSLLFMGIGGACFATMQGTLTYLAAPPEYRSRVLGVLTLCIGTAPIGFFNIGSMAEAFGVPIAMMISSAEGLTVLLLLWLYGNESKLVLNQ